MVQTKKHLYNTNFCLELRIITRRSLTIGLIRSIMNERYDKIYNAMFAMIGAINKRNQSFDKSIEKKEKNIASLLKILTKHK